MEMPLGDAAIGPPEKREIIQHLGQQRCVGPPFCQTRYYILIVIGEISTDRQLDSVKEHIKKGESPAFRFPMGQHEEFSSHTWTTHTLFSAAPHEAVHN